MRRGKYLLLVSSDIPPRASRSRHAIFIMITHKARVPPTPNRRTSGFDVKIGRSKERGSDELGVSEDVSGVCDACGEVVVEVVVECDIPSKS
jgi:hypothetical protein